MTLGISAVRLVTENFITQLIVVITKNTLIALNVTRRISGPLKH